MSMRNSLYFLACGHVDDGKSTLMGRLLFDIGAIPDDQICEAMVKGELDYSLLTDGLEDERSQGITIDVAYRYFRHKGRAYRIADTPGHVQYTRNMAVAAADSDVAVILVDAAHGVREQTLTHSHIAAFFGIRTFLIVVNKMDLVGFDEANFRYVSDLFRRAFNRDYFGEEPSFSFIPVCATEGDNVTSLSPRTPWYRGLTLLEGLEQAKAAIAQENGLRLPVQYVIRTKSGTRGYQGMLTGGKITVGDNLHVTGTPRSVTVKAVYHGGREVGEASNGQAVTVMIDDDMDLARGSVLFAGNAPMNLLDAFPAQILWIEPNRLAQKRVRARLKIHTRDAQVEVENLGASGPLMSASISAESMLPVDAFETNKSTGLFILTDQESEKVIGVGAVGMAGSSSAAIDYCI
jgi:sulfate adenylyltransferase large subunit